MEAVNQMKKLVYGDVYETIKAMKICAIEGRRMGLLSLESMICNAPETPILMRIGIQLLVDGMSAEIIEKILTNLIEAEGLKDDALVEAKVTRTGILSLQQGDHPSNVVAQCCAHLGVAAYTKYTGECNPFSKEVEKSELQEDTLFGVPMDEVRAREKLSLQFIRLYKENPGFSALEYLASQEEK